MELRAAGFTLESLEGIPSVIFLVDGQLQPDHSACVLVVAVGAHLAFVSLGVRVSEWRHHERAVLFGFRHLEISFRVAHL